LLSDLMVTKMKPHNILFIMCDQLRADYLSCYGHPHLQTPNIDRLAERGARFTHAYVQSPLCGPSRTSTYTGRYVSSHGVTINNVPLRVDERTLGDYLRDLGVRTAVVGKTHMVPNVAEMARLGIDPQSELGQSMTKAGFEPYFHDDGVHPNNIRAKNSPYNQELWARGYDTDNPWFYHANSAQDEDGNYHSGWLLQNAGLPANIKEEDSETAVSTQMAMKFIEEAGEQPWCLHLSYIKPHWPYIAPAPYHNLYGPEHIIEPNRSETELDAPHPVYAAFMEQRESRAFSRNEVREAVIPTYMGLIKQIDDQIGLLLNFLEEHELFDSTLIVFTSDHGDYLGDHWLGEKDLFHQVITRVPLIIVDPSQAAHATRGKEITHLVEAIDLVPTFIEFFGGEPGQNQLEGHSLLPLLRGQQPDTWREYAISEIDYSWRNAREILQQHVDDCRAYMVRTRRWKLIYYNGFRPQLFDLDNDPQELCDLGEDPNYQSICDELTVYLLSWQGRRKSRMTVTSEQISYLYEGESMAKRGVLLGFWSDEDLEKVLGQDGTSTS
jgi:arylsulfatase A-like enzyme